MAAKAVGGHAHIDAIGSQSLEDVVDVFLRVVRVKVFDELIAVRHVDGTGFHRQAHTVANASFDVRWKIVSLRDDGGHIHGDDLLRPRRDGHREAEVTGADLEQARVAVEVPRQQPELPAHVLRAACKLAGQLRVVGNPSEQLLVNLRVQAGPLGGGRTLEPV